MPDTERIRQKLQRQARMAWDRAERFRAAAEGRSQPARRILVDIATNAEDAAKNFEARAYWIDAISGAFRFAFEATPHPYLLLTPKLDIASANDAYLSVTMTRRNDIVGTGIFDVFPDNPADAAADGVRNLKASLVRVLDRGAADPMARQRYDIRRPDGLFEERWWQPINIPVFNGDRRLMGVLHHVEDVTAAVKAGRCR
jgi:PAS domain-containing protein